MRRWLFVLGVLAFSCACGLAFAQAPPSLTVPAIPQTADQLGGLVGYVFTDAQGRQWPAFVIGLCVIVAWLVRALTPELNQAASLHFLHTPAGATILAFAAALPITVAQGIATGGWHGIAGGVLTLILASFFISNPSVSTPTLSRMARRIGPTAALIAVAATLWGAPARAACPSTGYLVGHGLSGTFNKVTLYGEGAGTIERVNVSAGYSANIYFWHNSDCSMWWMAAVFALEIGGGQVASGVNPLTGATLFTGSFNITPLAGIGLFNSLFRVVVGADFFNISGKGLVTGLLSGKVPTPDNVGLYFGSGLNFDVTSPGSVASLAPPPPTAGRELPPGYRAEPPPPEPAGFVHL